MQKLGDIRWLPVFMGITIIAIAAFQLYWLQQTYHRENFGLERQTNMMFRETVRGLQASKLKLDKVVDTTHANKFIVKNDVIVNQRARVIYPKMVGMIDAMMQKIRDSTRETVIFKEGVGKDSIRIFDKKISGRRERLMQFLFEMDSLQDSIRISELYTAYEKRLDRENLDVPFVISRIQSRDSREPTYNEVTIGFQSPVTYRINLGNTTGFLLKRIGIPILFSLFLVGFTLLSFYLLYKNLIRQKRLGDIKNEFISNITHELKTPIATVSVAIEALRSFNASFDERKTREYLDISANELQRLSLLVDKVLKLSMFEKKEIELVYEPLDMKDLVNEVTSSMRLQFEKHHANIDVQVQGDSTMEGDRLHLVSVIFNMLDNALKYSKDKPRIDIMITGNSEKIMLSIADSGIGIPQEYQHRIFEKFFRVPTGNLHNAKGYGLGLSYVAHVIKRHQGSIRVESVESEGCRFIIQLPKHQSTSI